MPDTHVDTSTVNHLQPFERCITLDNHEARYYQLTGLTTDKEEPSARPIAHFYGGNGFTVGVYEPLLNKLSDSFSIVSLAMRGYWYDQPKAKVLTREQDADYLIEFLEKTQTGPVIGIGHSQGATATAMAAAKRPDLFSALFLIDPVTFTKEQTLLFRMVPSRLKLTQEPFKSTRVKKADWPSSEAYYDYLRKHRAYKRISDDHLKIYTQNSLVPKANGKGYTLFFPPKQELASYFGTPYINDALEALNLTEVPYTMILAKPSVFNSDKVRASWKELVADDRIVHLPTHGHLVPLEAPSECAEIIKRIAAPFN